MVDAMWKVVVSLILFMVSPGDGLFCSIYQNAHISEPFGGNAGRPLFLNPYIRAGKIKEGKSENARWYFKSKYPPRCKTLVSVLIQWLYFKY